MPHSSRHLRENLKPYTLWSMSPKFCVECVLLNWRRVLLLPASNFQVKKTDTYTHQIIFICVCVRVRVCVCVCSVSQELRSLFRDLIPELILSQKRHIHKRPIRNGSGVMSF